MQDLAQIRSQNLSSGLGAVTNLINSGKHVVAVFHGLNYTGHESFDTAADASDYAAKKGAEFGVTVKVYSPTEEAVAA